MLRRAAVFCITLWLPNLVYVLPRALILHLPTEAGQKFTPGTKVSSIPIGLIPIVSAKLPSIRAGRVSKPMNIIDEYYDDSKRNHLHVITSVLFLTTVEYGFSGMSKNADQFVAECQRMEDRARAQRYTTQRQGIVIPLLSIFDRYHKQHSVWVCVLM